MRKKEKRYFFAIPISSSHTKKLENSNVRFSRKTRGRRQRDRQRDRETERQRDRDRPGFKGPSVSFGAVGPKTQNRN